MSRYKVIIFSSLLFFLFLGTSLFVITEASPLHLTNYHKLSKKPPSPPLSYPSHKTTHKEFSKALTKDIWVRTSPQYEQQISLKSQGADLDFIRHKGNVEVLENMKDVKIWVQEELFYHDQKGNKKNHPTDFPMQQILLLEAQEATYHWNRHMFVCHNALITRYVKPGHRLTTLHQEEKETILLQGKAKKASLNYDKKKIVLNTRHLKASIYR